MVSAKRNNTKLLVALIGGSGVIAMGALSAAFGQEQTGQEWVAKSSNMNVGATTTETTPPLVEATTMAAPAMKGPAPLPPKSRDCPDVVTPLTAERRLPRYFVPGRKRIDSSGALTDFTCTFARSPQRWGETSIPGLE